MIFSYLLNMQSHPSWVCGLKLYRQCQTYVTRSSHPSWVCGLKLFGSKRSINFTGHTLRGCVD